MKFLGIFLVVVVILGCLQGGISATSARPPQSVWVLRKPDGFSLTNNDAAVPLPPMQQSDLLSYLYRTLGVSDLSGCSWPALTVTNPFSSSQDVVMVSIPAAADSSNNVHPKGGVKIALEGSFNPTTLLYALDDALYAQLGSAADIELIRPELYTPGQVNAAHMRRSFNGSVAADTDFAEQIDLLTQLPSKVQAARAAGGASARVYLFELNSLNRMISDYGAQDERVKTAFQVLNRALDALAVDLDKEQTNNKVSVLAVACQPPTDKDLTFEAEHWSDSETVSHARSKRQAADDNFVVALHMILWICLILFLVTLATSIGIGSMDPGWDSIIYRMTSQRMKKDN